MWYELFDGISYELFIYLMYPVIQFVLSPSSEMK